MARLSTFALLLTVFHMAVVMFALIVENTSEIVPGGGSALKCITLTAVSPAFVFVQWKATR
jgi:hypothetical protein